jgi:hypothetical protein
MKFTVTFTDYDPDRDFRTDNLECWFRFTLIENTLLGTPREVRIPHTVKVTIADILMKNWGLPGAVGSHITEEMVKVAFQVAEEYISKQLKKKHGELEEELPPHWLNSENARDTLPYNIANIPYPENIPCLGEGHFTVDVIESESDPKLSIHPIEPAEYFVDLSRIAELRGVTSQEFDLTKLIQLCEELNICYANGCYFAVAMLTRAIIDHIPPVFEFSKFTEVANNYGGGGSSFKKSMRNLQSSSRNIADSYLHLQIRKKESLPTKVQVDFRANLDVLLAEIVRSMK